MNYYIFYEHLYNRYSLIDESGFTRVANTRGNEITYSPSFLLSDSIWIAAVNNNSGSIIDEQVYKDEIINTRHNNYSYFVNKLDDIEKIPRVETDTTDFQYLLGDKNDKNTVVAAYNWKGIVATGDYHEAINAFFLNISYIFRIPKDIRYFKNYKKYHIIKINKGVKLINKKIK